MNQLIAQLRAWQFREWLFALLFAVALTLTVFVVLLATACVADWVYDRYADTPLWLKLPLTVVLVLGTLAAAFGLFRRVRASALDELAYRAEHEFPDVEHRFVTSLQLTRPEARTEGMSVQLIEAVADEAGEFAARKRLAALADTTKLKRAACVFVPLLVILAACFALFGHLVVVLLQRQCYLNVDIPRSTTLTVAHQAVWPSGDAVTLRVRVAGPIREDDTGVAIITATADNGTVREAESYELKFEKWETENEVGIFAAKLPPASESFTFHARLADGRTRTPGEMKFVSRPVVTEVNAYVRLPQYVDPDGQRRYERITPQGEVTAHRDCAVRVTAEISKPVTAAKVLLLGRDAGGAEIVLAEKPMALSSERRVDLDPETKKPKIDPDGNLVRTAVGLAEVTFDLLLPPEAGKAQPRLPTGYRIEVEERLKLTVSGADQEIALANANPPRRGISITPDDPPRVTLLDEVNKSPQDPGLPDEYEVRGIPLRLSDKVAIGYRASSPLGLLHAHLVYRVNDEATWASFPLTREVVDESKVGRFVPELGLFENYDYTKSVEFYPIPSGNPESEPSGLVAGGKYVRPVSGFFKLTADKKFRTVPLQIGDRIEFYVAVYDRKYALLPADKRGPLELSPTTPPAGAASGSGDRPPAEVPANLRPPGVSESRIKKIVSREEFQAWLDQRDRSKESLRRIEDLQRGISGQRK